MIYELLCYLNCQIRLTRFEDIIVSHGCCRGLFFIVQVVTILQACVLVQRVIRFDIVRCVEDEEHCRTVIDTEFEPPIGNLTLCQVVKIFELLLVLCEIVDSVVDAAELVDHVVRDLVEVTECVHVEVASRPKLKNARVARESYRVHSCQHILR